MLVGMPYKRVVVMDIFNFQYIIHIVNIINRLQNYDFSWIICVFGMEIRVFQTSIF